MADERFFQQMGIVRPPSAPTPSTVTRMGGPQGPAPDSLVPKPVEPPAATAAPNGRPPAAPGPLPLTTAPEPSPGVNDVRQQLLGPPPTAEVRPQAAGPSGGGGGIGGILQPQPQVVRFATMPKAWELDSLPEGARAETPYGPVERDSTGQPVIQFTPAGRQQYAAETVRLRSSFGPHPFASVQGAPPPPVTPGRPSFNPFTGFWVR